MPTIQSKNSTAGMLALLVLSGFSAASQALCRAGIVHPHAASAGDDDPYAH